MHQWGDERVDWQGINDAAEYIALWLRKWARISVFDYKEKWGTVRISTTFGWHGIYPIYRPGYCWYPKWWPMRLDFWLANTTVWGWLNDRVVILQKKAYVWRYIKAIEKWPHLYNEIVSQADWGELFEGKIPGYTHSHYWTKIE